MTTTRVENDAEWIVYGTTEVPITRYDDGAPVSVGFVRAMFQLTGDGCYVCSAQLEPYEEVHGDMARWPDPAPNSDLDEWPWILDEDGGL